MKPLTYYIPVCRRIYSLLISAGVFLQMKKRLSNLLCSIISDIFDFKKEESPRGKAVFAEEDGYGIQHHPLISSQILH